MKTWDDELQDSIASGRSAAEGPDAQAYQAVFKALEKEPEFTLPPAFAHRIMRKIETREQKRSLWRELRALAAGILLMIVSLGVTVYLTGFRLELGVLKDAKPYLSFIAFGIVFIALLHWVDRRFISRRQSTAG